MLKLGTTVIALLAPKPKSLARQGAGWDAQVVSLEELCRPIPVPSIQV